MPGLLPSSPAIRRLCSAGPACFLILPALLLAACTGTLPPPQMPQYPSPMEEHARAHGRIAPPEAPAAAPLLISGILAQPVQVFLPVAPPETPRLLIHFHGSAYVPATGTEDGYAVAAVHLGGGSGVYERAFADARTFPALLGALQDSLAHRLGPRWHDADLHLSAFSAGYGAIRALLQQPAVAHRVDALILLDGLHTDYIPPRRVLADGGTLNAAKLQPFLDYARRAVAGEATLIFTHSAVFPGTYASTTETADFLLRALGLQRTAVLRWGPQGMQQLSEATAGRLKIMGFAGNTAPDHVDHLHALPAWLPLLHTP